VQQLLEKGYASWRYERVSDLPEEYQKMWTTHNPKDCPGFAAGHFINLENLSYAVLLISGSGQSVSSKLLVVNRTKKGTYAATVLTEEKTTQHYEVVSRVPPGAYSDPEGGSSVRLRLDGVLLEALEVGSTLYYWRNGRFHSLVLSE
jgi:hypothetical protein